jgi:hypothetical protein
MNGMIVRLPLDRWKEWARETGDYILYCRSDLRVDFIRRTGVPILSIYLGGLMAPVG